MAVLFRPFFPVDKTHWIPALQEGLGDLDLRIWPDAGNPREIDYLIGWGLEDGDASAWPNLKAVLSLRAGLDRWFIGSPNLPEGAALVRMIDPGLIGSMAAYVCAYVLRCHLDLKALECGAGGDLECWSADRVPVGAAQRSVGILGLGELGAACARSLGYLGFRLCGWSRTPKALPGVESFVGPAGLEACLARSEILVCLLPLTPETENILDAGAFALIPKGGWVINAARGAHVVDSDLIDALNSGHLAGAVLDVFRKEPLPENHPFRGHRRITATPHISAITDPRSGTAALRRSIEAIERGEKPSGLYDPARGY